MRADGFPLTFPLTYDECRARFRWACRRAGLRPTAHPIAARGPDGQRLTIDAVSMGAESPQRALLVLAGVHGVEGFSSSVLMCDAIERWAGRAVMAGDTAIDPGIEPADDTAVVFVHGVNPWGMAWWRRQNESNVDLNRNWGRDALAEVPVNEGYEQLHPVLVPGGSAAPDAEELLASLRRLSAAHGGTWVKAAITEGQYAHSDGLYFGGDRTEESTALVAAIVGERLSGAHEVLVVDLHTGHGAFGEYTLLSPVPVGHPDDEWLRRVFEPARIESTASAGARTPPKRGQLARGLAEVVPGARWRTVTMELGTVSDARMIINERAEHWVHLHGDRSLPSHADIVWAHRCASTPDDPMWEAAARRHGVEVLDAALRAVASWPREPADPRRAAH